MSLTSHAHGSVSSCDTSTETTLSACTEAQRTAHARKSDALIEGTLKYYDHNIYLAYIAYLDKIIAGYTPNDDEFQAPEMAVKEHLERDSTLSFLGIDLVSFSSDDVFPDFVFDETQLNSDKEGARFISDSGNAEEKALDWAGTRGCTMRICNTKGNYSPILSMARPARAI